MSAREGNIVNAPKQLDEISELSDLKKFLQYLWWLINTVEHSDSNLTKEQRYENSLKAIFGDNYQKWSKPPEGCTYEDMRQIKLQENKTGNRRESIREFMQSRMPLLDTTGMNEIEEYDAREEREDALQTQLAKIEQHLIRNQFLYEGQYFEEGRGGFPWEEDIDTI
ncbi:MAG: hypothetical protein KUG81_09350 [Gammaproteobacteria bacterium]|nr:hypothetical protein [Gammaproteobacteria bacterium]